MIAIYKKELKAYFNSMMGYAIIAFFMLVLAVYFMGFNLSGKSATIGYTLSGISFVFTVILPILTMRLLSEEQRQKTDQLLFSSPIKISDIVIGKFLAVVTVYTIPVLVACTMPLVLSQFGKVAYLKSYSTIFAFWLLGCVMLSIGVLISSFTENQVVAAVASFGANVAIFLMSSIATLVPQTKIVSLIGFSIMLLMVVILIYVFTKNIVVTAILAVLAEGGLVAGYFIVPTFFEAALTKTLTNISFYSRFSDFVDGSFNVGSVVYYISFTLLFLFLTMQSIQKRRWS